jgi:hypothetical protein
MSWNHATVYRALVANGQHEQVLRSERYVHLYEQQPNCAVLYAPGGARSGAGPLHLNEARESFRADVFERISPAIEFVRRDNKGPDKDSQNFDWYQVVDWDRFAEALGLRHNSDVQTG